MNEHAQGQAGQQLHLKLLELRAGRVYLPACTQQAYGAVYQGYQTTVSSNKLL